MVSTGGNVPSKRRRRYCLGMFIAVATISGMTTLYYKMRQCRLDSARLALQTNALGEVRLSVRSLEKMVQHVLHTMRAVDPLHTSIHASEDNLSPVTVTIVVKRGRVAPSVTDLQNNIEKQLMDSTGLGRKALAVSVIDQPV